MKKVNMKLVSSQLKVERDVLDSTRVKGKKRRENKDSQSLATIKAHDRGKN